MSMLDTILPKRRTATWRIEFSIVLNPKISYLLLPKTSTDMILETRSRSRRPSRSIRVQKTYSNMIRELLTPSLTRSL
ncbi:hypothetical protein EYC80_006946 [Monilinia laxa]|uniref:Uncharacterized protein n=1 Tax=Monilinia laxa TaxID=61186 RepID=A0A5N6K018_MONLA|nr:hypothetical protein EYC80_006946 [Monilinia laxa]